ncbi:MAG: hypothetical protein JSS64_01750 [Bacteroidetes bacterium]|nr:hypothetical protein [Bacteroidota bacterium]
MNKLFILVVCLLCGCKTIIFEHDESHVYYDCGTISHYYSNPKYDFGINLYHGAKFYNWANGIHSKQIDRKILKYFSDKKFLNTLLIQDYLSPSVLIIQKRKKEEDVRLHLMSDSIHYFTLKGSHHDTIFCGHKDFLINDSQYRIVAFSYNHALLKPNNTDKPSFENCTLSIDNIVTNIVDSDVVSHAFHSKDFLLNNLIQLFLFSKNNYLLPLNALSYYSPATIDTTEFYESSTTFNSFFNNRYWQTLSDRSKISMKSDYRDSNITKITLCDAEKIIYDSAAKHKIVILNEAHTQPHNRLFLAQVLDSLYALGYKTLFVETIDEADQELNTRKYPLQKSGFYTSEPSFGNAVRKALHIGFKVLPYDNQLYDTEREIEQARTIANFVQKNPSEKILVYCGHQHLCENPTDSMMGFFLKTTTSIDPFTIEQTLFIEKGDTEKNSNIYKYIISKFPFSKPQGILKNNVCWHPNKLVNDYDLLIVTPPEKNSIVQYPMGSTYEISFNGLKYKNALFQVFDDRELKYDGYWNLVPIHNLILSNKNTIKIILDKGSYSIYVTDKYRNVIFQNKIKI